MAIRLDEVRIRLLNINGGIQPTVNNTYNLGTSSLKWANVYATTFHGVLNGNANTATALTSSAGSTTQPIYFSNGKPVAITGNIANGTTGNAATATKLATARTISLTGSVTGSGSFDGSGNLSIATTTNHNHDDRYLNVSGDTMTGNITFNSIGDSGTSSKIIWNGSTDGADIYYRTDGADMGRLVFNLRDDSNTYVCFALNGTNFATINTSGHFSGNAATATKLQTARTISLTGSVTGSGTFDGSGNLSIATTTNHSHNSLINSDSAGTLTWSGDYMLSSANRSQNKLHFGLDSLYRYKNDDDAYYKILDALNYTSYTVTKTGSGASGTWGIGISGNASTASKLATARTISLTGSVTGSGSFDGSGNLSITTTTNHTHNYAAASHTHNYAGSPNAGGIAYKSYEMAPSYNVDTSNTANKPWHRICYTNSLAAAWRDTEALVLFQACYVGGPCGLAKISLRGNNTSNPSMSIQWLFNSNLDVSNLQYGLYYGSSGEGYYADVFLKVGTWARTSIIIISNPGGWTFCNSSETTDGASYSECYTGINARTYSTTGTSNFTIVANTVYGAVWNDYAEYRESDCEEFGYVLAEKGDDTLTKTTERLQPFAGVSSDTWGFCQGETERAKTPIAVAGRVLVYTYRNRNDYKPGDVVCAAPNGTVDIMTREEVINYPDRIVGTVSCVPKYDTWGNGDRDPVKVNGRIWIKVK